MSNWYEEEEEVEYEEGRTDYSKRQLELLADQLLREDVKRELCRVCDKYGEDTGHVESKPQYKESGAPVTNKDGEQLYVDFPEYECELGHRWYKGEGKARSIAGENPILFEEHMKSRQRREIYTTVGTPDPSIVAGIYNRVHPQGRKVNSDAQRKRNGASFYR